MTDQPPADGPRDPARRSVREIVPELEFDDDPSSFAVVLDELADRHVMDDDR